MLGKPSIFKIVTLCGASNPQPQTKNKRTKGICTGCVLVSVCDSAVLRRVRGVSATLRYADLIGALLRSHFTFFRFISGRS